MVKVTQCIEQALCFAEKLRSAAEWQDAQEWGIKTLDIAATSYKQISSLVKISP